MREIQRGIFQELGELSSSAYFIYNTKQNSFDYINAAFEKIWGVPVGAVMNNPGLLLETLFVEDRTYVKEQYRKVRRSVAENKFEFRIKSNDSERYIYLSLYPIKDNEEIKWLAGIAEDITALKSNMLYAEKINARKNSMLEIVGHDLKGPIGMVNMVASTIEKDLDEANYEGVSQSVEFIRDMCQRNINLIRELLSQEFLESPEVDLFKERADLVWGINDVIQRYKKSSPVLSKKFTLTSFTDKLYIQYDNLKFIQAFNNLISNAIKFTADNGLIEVDISDGGSSVLITVKDNGIGIPEDLQPYLFDKFTKARRRGLHGEEPVGLGMSIIKTIIELHKGRIWFESQVNKGTTFYIELPKE